ncbi:hypothetical protein PLESTB_001785800 [Pleodorina starrii]|uniref:RNA polymerase-associated protein LEO1 n=1 Tax=Pleodorina starrii TaxID=330485 RepID=A0A9W6C199_9CHLO|nr:hypothetical protein PLESTM_001756600 [Pleodorina starrii]GLC61640.1 hypothetical protein PLESTB_001785800 [Pleodorina starrii]GLC76536.1 hypothetical protein PLESTF_001793800 [Pleodorina starrii]
MASDDEDQNMKDLFGSDDDEDDDFGKGNLRDTSRKGDDDDAEPAPEDNLEDDLDDGAVQATARQLPASEEPEEQVDRDDDRDRDRRRRYPPGHRPLARTGPPVDFAAPLLPVPLPQGEVYLLREALIGVEPTPFKPETFTGEEEIFIDEKGVTKIKPVDRTKIRWRYVTRSGPDGSEEMVPESNARFVRWSDGSLQLLLGDEVFDVVTADITQQRAYMVAYSGVVQGQAAMTSKMGFRLATLNSKLYARMREEVDKRTVKVKRVQQHVEALDPSKEKERRAKEAEELLRNRAQLEARQQRTMARYAGAGGGGGRSRGRPTLNTRFLEEEDGIEGGGDDAFIDDDDDGGGYSRRRRMNDDEEEEAARRLQSAKRMDGGGAHGAAGRRRSRAQKEESEEEELDEEEEEEEYVDSEGGSEDEDDGGDDEGGEEEPPGRRAKSPPPKAGKITPPPRIRPSMPARDTRQPAAKVRRGVVLSDDEDD